jgi:uncharacterized protein (UPF0333 family)
MKKIMLFLAVVVAASAMFVSSAQAGQGKGQKVQKSPKVTHQAKHQAKKLAKHAAKKQAKQTKKKHKA